jgi:nucleoside-diphosphate-sugar epimerase
MKIYIAGSTGFIGSSLLKKLRLQNREVFSINRKQIFNLSNMQIADNPYQSSILLYLAESNDRNYVNKQPESFKKEALDRLNNLLRCNFKKIIYASSVSLYSDENDEPRTEKHPVIINDLYSQIKIESENIIIKNNGIVLRLSNVYGNGMSKINVLSDIIRQKNCGDIELKTTYPVRDFIYIDDVVESFIKSIECDGSGVFNIASGVSYSIGELASTILKEAGNLRYNIKSRNNEEVFSKLIIDIKKAEAKLNWTPKINLETGIGNLLYDESRK